MFTRNKYRRSEGVPSQEISAKKLCDYICMIDYSVRSFDEVYKSGIPVLQKTVTI